MLIIAIPKSASTSLLHTLGAIHKLNSLQDFKEVKDNALSEDFALLGKYHSDCRELNRKNVQKWTREKKSFYKQHIPPTDNNLELLNRSRKIILLREPEDVILAYKRAEMKGLHQKREEFKNCVTDEDWLERAKKNRLYSELNKFYNIWLDDSSERLIIKFENLISNEEETLRTISEYFNLQMAGKDISLKKYRYSHHNILEKYLYKCGTVIKNIFSSK